MRRALVALLVVAVLASWAVFLARSPSSSSGDAVVVYLVRHAERAEDGTDDPPISDAGQARARLLADLLRDAGVTHVHSTGYLRTRSTAEPFATRSGLGITSYDPRDLSTFAAELLATPGRHLVVGHSNTTPDLVEALGGDPGGPIDEAEYDRLYVVTRAAGGGISTVLLRFGQAFGG
jgi:phosphohistidine phosphatase SixA